MVNVAPNTSEFGKRLGPTEQPTTAPPPPDLSAPQPTVAQPTTTPVPVPQPTFWTVDEAQKANGMNPDFDARLQRMIAASGGRLSIASGYRSVALQTDLYNKAVAKFAAGGAGKWVAPPGHSNHNRGEAADLAGDLGWAHQHAAEFGLVFPMSWENWHIEPVGLRAGSSPDAYTNGGPGTTNPTADQSIDSQPSEIAATLASTLGNSVGGLGAIQQPSVTSLNTSGAGANLTATSIGGPEITTGNYNTPHVVGTASSDIPGSAQTGGDTGGTNTSYAGGASVPTSPNQKSFIDTITPYAQAESKRTGIPPEVFIVQSGLETGWGTSWLWRNKINPAGIGAYDSAHGNAYPSVEAAFKDYADKLMGVGEAGQEKFAADVKAGASAAQLLADLEQSPWAAGKYGGNGLSQTYAALHSAGAFNAPTPTAQAPAATQPAPQPENQRRNRLS